jgi:triacylglycerol lipase
VRKDIDVVLIHGLMNWHRWGDRFLTTLAEALPTGRVFAVYTDRSERIWERRVGRGRLIGCGSAALFHAGRASIREQTYVLSRKLQLLHKEYGLGVPFDIVGHSMGGLVGRCFAYHNPGAVRNLVTLGTPHRGTPLAPRFLPMARLIGSLAAISDLTPRAMQCFNREYPLTETPLADGGRVYTVRGFAHGGVSDWGTSGEVWFGWHILRRRHGTASDGLVPAWSSVIDGAVHIGDFPNCNHLDLVCRSDVAQIVAQVLSGAVERRRRTES